MTEHLSNELWQHDEDEAGAVYIPEPAELIDADWREGWE